MDNETTLQEIYQERKDMYKSAKITCLMKYEEREFKNLKTIIILTSDEAQNKFDKIVEVGNIIGLRGSIDSNDILKIIEKIGAGESIQFGEHIIEMPKGFGKGIIYNSEEMLEQIYVPYPSRLYNTSGSGDMMDKILQQYYNHYKSEGYESIYEALSDKLKFKVQGASASNWLGIYLPNYQTRILNAEIYSKRIVVDVATNLPKKRLKFAVVYQPKNSPLGYDSNRLNTDVEIPRTIIDLHEAVYQAQLYLWDEVDKRFALDQRNLIGDKFSYLINTLISSNHEYGIIPFHPENRHISKLLSEKINEFKSALTISSSTSEKCVDSLDYELLSAIKHYGGEYDKFLLELIKCYSSDDIQQSLVKLGTFNHIRVSLDKVTLTVTGIEILSLPPIAFQAILPSLIANKIGHLKSELYSSNWDGVINEGNRILEHILKVKLELEVRKKFNMDIEEWWKTNMKGKKSFNKVSLGDLREPLIKEFHTFERNHFLDRIIDAFLTITGTQKHSNALDSDKNQTSIENAAIIADHLVEIFVRYWYKEIDNQI